MQFNKYTHTHTHTREDQCEWHRMTRMTGPDCVVMCNLINTHTHTHTTLSLNNRAMQGDRFTIHSAYAQTICVICYKIPRYVFIASKEFPFKRTLPGMATAADEANRGGKYNPLIDVTCHRQSAAYLSDGCGGQARIWSKPNRLISCQLFWGQKSN